MSGTLRSMPAKPLALHRAAKRWGFALVSFELSDGSRQIEGAAQEDRMHEATQASVRMGSES